MLYLTMLMHRLADRAKEEKGAALAEYGLLVALIAVACYITIGLLGTAINDAFVLIEQAIAGAN